MALNTKILAQAATEARGLTMDAVQAAASGHLGLPLGCAEVGAVLFGYALSYLPEDPRWINRDRLILSAGHGSMFLYGWLHMAGYDVPLDQIKQFRQLHSITPGHPEFGDTPGVECTTGPLGYLHRRRRVSSGGSCVRSGGVRRAPETRQPDSDL
jgi:transketolase